MPACQVGILTPLGTSWEESTKNTPALLAAGERHKSFRRVFAAILVFPQHSLELRVAKTTPSLSERPVELKLDKPSLLSLASSYPPGGGGGGLGVQRIPCSVHSSNRV